MHTAWPWSGLGASLIGASSLHLVLAAALSNGFDGQPAVTQPSAIAEPARVTIELRPTVGQIEPEPQLPPTNILTTEPAPALSATDNAAYVPAALAPPLVPEMPVSEGRRYFSIQEVDTPAVPQPDWRVDVERLLGMGVSSFHVNVLIDETGRAERCAVTRIDPEQAIEVQQAIATTLCETQLRPAWRRGVAVPSVRHIELLLAAP